MKLLGAYLKGVFDVTIKSTLTFFALTVLLMMFGKNHFHEEFIDGVITSMCLYGLCVMVFTVVATFKSNKFEEEDKAWKSLNDEGEEGYTFYLKNNLGLTEILERSGKTITFAESITGGLIAKKITDIPGASKCFKGSFVTYSDETKENFIGVKNESLNKCSAVSATVALEMCKGAREKTGADIAISVTGLAGPVTNDDIHAVGTVYFGICAEDEHAYTKQIISGTRDEIREKAAEYALYLAKNYLIFKNLKPYEVFKSHNNIISCKFSKPEKDTHTEHAPNTPNTPIVKKI